MPVNTRQIVEYLISKFGDDLISVYGIGSAFLSDCPPNDIDVVVILSDLRKCPEKRWSSAKFETIEIDGTECWLLYGIKEGYFNKEIFKSMSFSNWEWSVKSLKYGSKHLWGDDFREELPDPDYDYLDMIRRVGYHLEPTSIEKMERARIHGKKIDDKMRFTKSAFKFGFLLVAMMYPDEHIFGKENVFHRLKTAYKNGEIDKYALVYYKLAMNYRRGNDIPSFEHFRDEFIGYAVKKVIEYTDITVSEIMSVFHKGFRSPFSYLIRHVESVCGNG